MTFADPITTQVIRYGLEQIADEMGYTMVRTSRSTIIKEIMDITCAVSNARGQTLAQAHHAPMLLTGFEITMAEIIRRFPDQELADGDVIISNDPYLGGQHVMDLQTFAPVRFEGKLVGFVGSIAHHSDMGGAAAGGVAGGLTEIYLEGLRLPMVKLYKKGGEDQEIFRIIEKNIRVPDKTLGDIRAQAASNFVGVKRMKEIFQRYGIDTVEACADRLMDYSERRMREGLQKIPDGVYTGVDYVDDDGISDRPIKIQVNIHKQGDSAVIDFNGTDRQVRGNVNCPIATAHAAVYYSLICVIDPKVPPNSGCYRPFTINIEEGLVPNPISPAAVGARTNTSQKIAEATMQALAQALPDKVMAGSHANIMTCGFAGIHPKTGKQFVHIDIQGGGAGARPTKDGRDGQDSHLARFMNTPVEAAELEVPLRIERYELIPDTGGAGKFRGALALRRDVRALIDDLAFNRYGDRQKFPPPGLFGGKPGSMGKFILNPDTPDEQPLKSKGMSVLKKGDVVSIRTPGAGGYGNPAERNIEALKTDIKDNKVSEESAGKDYGVEVK